MFLMVFILIFVVLSVPAVNADELVWKEDIKPLTLNSSYTSYNDFFLYDGTKTSEQDTNFSASSSLAQEGQGWGYELALDAKHSLSSIKSNTGFDYKTKALAIQFSPVVYLSDKQRLYFNASLNQKALRPGEGIAQFQLTGEQIERKQAVFETIWRYGSELSPRYFDVKLGTSREDYNQATLLVNRAEYKSVYATVEMGFAYTQASHLLARVHAAKDTYLNDSNRDANYYNAQLGASWNPSSATGVKLLLGYFSRQFERANLKDSSGLSWNIEGTWSPVERFELSIFSGRDSEISQDLASADTVSETFGLEMAYDIDSQMRLNLGVKYKNQDFNNAQNIKVRNIKDDYWFARLTYEIWQSWFILLAFDQLEKTDSAGLNAYKQNLWTLGLEKEY